jgi:hypothetical protein
MKITIGTTTLANGTSRDEPGMVQGLEGARQVDQQPLTRSSIAGLWDRGNVSHTLTVQVTRHHATAGDAGDFVLSHASAVWMVSGTMTIESPSGKKWTMSQAIVERCSLAKWIGRTTVHNYVIRGGTFEAVAEEE